MAIPASIQALTAAAGYSAATGERILRPLRSAGLVPPGARFGGPDWEPLHLGTFLIACTSIQPIDAATTVDAFAACTYLNSPGQSDQVPRLGLGTFREVLVGMIEDCAAGLEAGEAVYDMRQGPNPRVLPAYLRFRHNPLQIRVTWITGTGTEEPVDVYAPSPGSPQEATSDPPPWRQSVITREATMPIGLIVGAAEAWLETRRRRGAEPLPTDLSFARGNDGAS